MASYLATILADSPNAVWRLNETSGTFADSTAHGLTATAHGSITRSVNTGFAGVGNGVSFGGTIADFIDIPNNALLNPAPVLTYECWVNLASTGSVQSMMAKGAQSAGAVDGLEFRVSAAGVLQAVFNFNGVLEFAGVAALSTAAWHYVVLTIAAGPTWAFYIDGALDNSASVGATGVTTTNTFNLGVNDTSAAKVEPMRNGSALCFAAVYPTALSAGQVAAHYAARNTASGGTGATIKKATPPSFVARTNKPPKGGPKGGPKSPTPVPVFGHLDGEQIKRKDQ